MKRTRKPYVTLALVCTTMTILSACEEAKKSSEPTPAQRPQQQATTPPRSTYSGGGDMVAGAGAQASDGSVELVFDPATFTDGQTPDHYTVDVTFEKSTGEKPFHGEGEVTRQGNYYLVKTSPIPFGEGTFKLVLQRQGKDLFSGEKPITIDRQTVQATIVLRPVVDSTDKKQSNDTNRGSTTSQDDKPGSNNGQQRTDQGTTPPGQDNNNQNRDQDQNATNGQTTDRDNRTGQTSDSTNGGLWKGFTLEGRDGWKIRFGTNN